MLALSVLCSASRSEASIVVEWSNQGSDLLATWSGSFDTTGYSFVGNSSGSLSGSLGANFNSQLMFLNTVASASTSDFSRTGAWAGAELFSFSLITGSSSSGDPLALDSNGTSTQLSVPGGYTSGDPLSGTITYPGHSIASVFGANLVTPKVMFNDGTNTVTFQTAVPEPSTVALLAGGVIAAAGSALRRRGGFVVTWLTVAVRGCGCRSRAERRRAG